MFKRYQQLPRWARLLAELGVFTLLWFSIQGWMKKDLSRGPLPAVYASDVRHNSPLNLPIDSKAPYVVHFWASWCPICKLMEGSVINISSDYKTVGVALQSGTSLDVISSMNEQGINYPVISDPLGDISRRFGVNAVPATFIVDVNNNIRFVERGYSSEWGLRLRLWVLNFF